MENPACAAFEEYGELPETVPFDFTKDDVTWVSSNISGAAGVQVAEEIELRNWIICFRFASEELRVIVSRLADWMDNFPLPWATYHTLIACCLVALNKSQGICSLEIGGTLHQDLAKLVMRAAGDQAKTACGKLHLCAGLKANIEGATHAVGASED